LADNNFNYCKFILLFLIHIVGELEMDKNLRLKLMTSAVLVAMAQMSTAYADDAAPAADAPVTAEAAAADATPLNLDKIVVTGSAKKISKMKSSVSISTMNATQVQNTGANNSAEVLRNVPGLRAESSGGESNVNLTSRGLPISAGGARWVQIQEDGLPILQIGDINFATPDTWLRIDQGLDKLEVIRGGSASTLATSAPGGIVNFINKTGTEKGGKIGLSTGLNFNEWRTDFSYGGPIDENGLRGFVSGFYRRGEGVRDNNTDMAKGGQIKGNITKQFDNGFARVNFKYLDDQTPSYLRVPTKSNGKTITEIPGIDPSTVSFYDLGIKDVSRTRENGLTTTDITDGVQAKTKSIGAELSFDVLGWNISDNFKYADNDGAWIGIHSRDPFDPVTGTFVATVFNTKLNDLSLTANDFRLSKAFETESIGKITPTFGLYTSWQQISETWSFNSYRVNPFNKTAVFLDNSSVTFGGCCTRDYDAEYRTIAPYAALALEVDKLNLDVSVRKDYQDVNGYYVQGATGVAGPAGGAFGARNNVDYSIDHTSWSVGANYRIDSNLAVFARASNGVAFNGDRILFPKANNLNNGGQNVNINEADQYELGTKWRTGNLSTFVTLFKAKVEESNFDLSIPKLTADKYDNQGVEVEMGYSFGNFNINGGLTYTDAQTLGVPAGASDKVQRQAKFVYQLTPSYRFRDKVTFIGNLVGTSSSRDSGIDNLLSDFAIVNAAVRYDYSNQWQINLSANNLFDTIGYTEADAGGNTARSVDGRSVKASAVYSF
jgi:outer membrane receptor protein involved in Fe transport